MRARYIIALLVAAGFAAPSAGHATSHTQESHHAPSAETAAALATGEVRKIDPDTKKITIRHGPLENLGMPPMTMVFQVSDPALLADVKAGDKVRFTAENKGGALVITRIERQ